ncbi:MAG: hypothetical protein ACJAVI_003912 [Candidatus Azotimanducaceae bacterium]|jgi:hypothetical protein
MRESFLLALIIGCEIGFWAVLILGLIARYILGLQRLSVILLLSVPLIDVVLLAVTMVDLGQGAKATFMHGLAAAYIGFSVGFGHSSITWADVWFAHRFADGEPQPEAPTHGWALVRYELIWWRRCVLAAAVTLSLVLVAIAYIDDPVRSLELDSWLTLSFAIVVMWGVFGPLWALLFSRSPPEV